MSCSGETAETLSALEEAVRRGCRLLVVGREGSPLDDLGQRGHAVFVLHGEKLSGGFALQRTRPGEKPQWLLIKRKDDAARPGSDVVAESPASVAGGKMFRASFCWWGHLAIAPAPDEDALVRASAALELLHASALVHDDLMDASDTRRGRMTTHRTFEAEHRAAGWRGGTVQYGAAAAVLIGLAAVEATWRSLLLFVPGRDASHAAGRPQDAKEAVRLWLGRWLAVALEFELAADILRTAVAPTWNEIGQLAAIVVLRTVLNYFLQAEIDKAETRRLGPAPG